MPHYRFFLWLVWMLWLTLLPRPALAQGPGDLDPTFDGDGKVTTNFDGAGVIDLGLQPDRKIIVTLYIDSISSALIRYHSNGSLDNTFGGAGQVLIDSVSSFSSSPVVIQPDGKILVADDFEYNGSNQVLAVRRYDSDGNPDKTFDGDGLVTTSFDNFFSSADSLALQPDGKIVAAGTSSNGSNPNFALTRYHPDGSLDHTFSGDGKLTTDFANNSRDQAGGVAIQPDGKIIVAGDRRTPSGNEVALVRYHPNGSLDHTFSGDGKVTAEISYSPTFLSAVFISDLALQPDGKILVLGYEIDTEIVSYYFLLRYNANGSLDNTFSGNGQGIVDSVGEEYNSLEVQTDGKILVAGRKYYSFPNRNFAVARYHLDGSPDKSFGDDGKVITDFGDSDGIADMTLQADGKLLVAGRSDQNIALARYFVPAPIYLPLLVKPDTGLGFK
jgi:uncharacterized delta-60 repeat protein